MTPIEVMVGSLAQSQKMLNGHLADFSDADMFVRPTPAANHTAWQLGHLIQSEAGMVNACAPGTILPPPAGFSDKFTKETAKNDDPKAFASKAELLAVFEKGRAATIAWAKTLTPADLETLGPEKMRDFIPTVGHLLALLPVHDAMHLGQVQVIRRKLGRPNIF
ncbi:MAG TPA: DinB family protein [Tepidisphaeraceae bacterium]|nr:DinB family protein [Tepidisphaeraceae bacterium]